MHLTNLEPYIKDALAIIGGLYLIVTIAKLFCGLITMANDKRRGT